MTDIFAGLPRVPVVHHASTDVYPEEVIGQAKPCVLKDYARHWPAVVTGKQGVAACQRYLISKYNGTPVQVMQAPPDCNGRLFYNDDLTGFNFTRSQAGLAEVFVQLSTNAALASPATFYVGSTRIDAVMPSFRADNDVLPLSTRAFASIWLGNQSRIAAHYDAPDNIAIVVAGRRRFTLFPPHQVANLYIGPLDFTPAGQPASLVDFHAPDFTRYPRFAEALKEAQCAVLEPGDAIYIPATWWHHVEGLDDFNVLVNYWWRQVEDYVGVPGDALLHALLAIKALPEAQRLAWRQLFDHYVFTPEPLAHIPQANLGVLDSANPTAMRQLRALLLNKLNR